jgi:magnesium chelatase family protein
VSLAHRGVLFLDELAEFSRGSLEALRQPIEDGHLVIGRAAGRARFPSDVLLVAATNPCPCGWRGVADRCTCRRVQIDSYRARISGPLRDRFDIEIEVRPVDPELLVRTPATRPFTPEAMHGAWAAQAARATRLELPSPWNARLPARLLPDAAGLDAAARQTLIETARASGLSGRGVHRCVRVARTIADLDAAETVTAHHIAQALGYRAHGS